MNVRCYSSSSSLSRSAKDLALRERRIWSTDAAPEPVIARRNARVKRM